MVSARNVHIDQRTSRCSPSWCAIRAPVKTMETCSEAKPAMPCTAAAPAGSISTSSRASSRLRCSAVTAVSGRSANNAGRTKAGPNDGSR